MVNGLIRCKAGFIVLAFFTFTHCAEAQTPQQIQNLKTFAKVYGYVKYFHPSDEASIIDFSKFAMYGAREVLNCQTSEQVIAKLEKLFLPVAPAISFYPTAEKKPFNKSILIPEHAAKCKTTYWQHQGVGRDMNLNGVYKSVRVNARSFKTVVDQDFGNVVTSIDARPYRGKNIRYSGSMRLIEKTEGTGHFWCRVDLENGIGFFNNMDENPVKSIEWQRYEIKGKVDSTATALVMGCFLEGHGQLFADDIKLEVWENNEWKQIELPNGNFETLSLHGKNAPFKARGGDTYKVEILKGTEVRSGNKYLSIKYEPKEQMTKGKSIFNHPFKVGELWETEIGNGISVSMPLALYIDGKSTYPHANDQLYAALLDSLKTINFSEEKLEFRIGNIINTYNVFKHFYPYFNEVKTDWDAEFEKSIGKSFTDKTRTDHGITLEEFTATLKDGHVWVAGFNSDWWLPPFKWERVENQMVVTQTLQHDIGISPGDVVEAVNGVPIEKYLEPFKKRISDPTPGWLNYELETSSLFGKQDSTIALTVNGKEIVLRRSVSYTAHRNSVSQVMYKQMDDGILYVNLDVITDDTLKKIIPKLVAARGIICDMRGYPESDEFFVKHLLKSKDTSKQWMLIPQIMYPDQKNIIGESKRGWGVRPENPYLGNKVVFITNAHAISYAESYMGFIEGYNLAPIVGQPTAGTNGNTNQFELPGGYRISWTGMKVVKHNGSQHHGIGILPDVFIERTIKGVKEGRDEFLEKAVEEIKKLWK